MDRRAGPVSTGSAFFFQRFGLQRPSHAIAVANTRRSVGRKANAGETLFGEVVRERQNEEQLCVLIHIAGDVPGVGLFGIYRMGESIRLSVCRFFYGPKAAETAAASEPKWQAWLDGVAKP